VWLIGARGSVAVTSIVGALALRAGLTEPIGCVTEHPALSAAGLPGYGQLTFGGHDIVATPLVKKAEALAAAGVVPAPLVGSLGAELSIVEEELRPLPDDGSQAEVAAAVAADLAAFRGRQALDRVVVVNVASTEPSPTPRAAFEHLDDLTMALAGPAPVLPPSALAAYAAFRAGCSYVDFTPSTGARLPALHDLAVQRGVPYAGNDGKTGETLLRSVLAPMFAMRRLAVGSWSGYNVLGGGDGQTLAEPAANAAKTASKRRVLAETLGYVPEGETRIDYVPAIGDFKTAWDLVTFAGFLGTPMRLEFTWHGCDSALAAPLVLDLARLVSAAHRVGRVGPLPELAFFFKDPIGDRPHELTAQWTVLREFAATLGRGSDGPTA
jgi:myo-inositol-1-phosphate synthase